MQNVQRGGGGTYAASRLVYNKNPSARDVALGMAFGFVAGATVGGVLAGISNAEGASKNGGSGLQVGFSFLSGFLIGTATGIGVSAIIAAGVSFGPVGIAGAIVASTVLVGLSGYDALGRRMRKVSNELQNATSQVTNFLYEGNEVIAKTDDSNQVLVSFTHSSLRTDDPLAMHITSAGVQAGIAQSPEDIFYAKDAQGSVIDLVDSNGLLVQHYAYSAFGKILSIKDQNDNDVTDAPRITPFITYTGKVLDSESGLIHFFARAYDPNLGRFIQIDPDQGKIGNPLTFNSKYVYALNNPINRVDPLGRISFKQTLGLLLIGYNPFLGLAIVNTEFGQKTFDFSKRDVNRINKAAIISGAVAVNVASGGTLTPVLLTTAGAGLFTAAISPEGQFFDNFLKGASVTAVSGAVFAGAGFAVGDTVPVTSFDRIITILSVTQNPNFQHSMESFFGQNDGDPFPGIEF